MQRSHLVLTIALLLSLIGLGAADALLVEGFPAALPNEPVVSPPKPPVAPSSSLSSSYSSSSSFAPVPVTPPPVPPPSSAPPPQGGVRKDQGKDVLQVVSALTFTAEETNERSLLSAVVQETSNSATSLPSGERPTEGPPRGNEGGMVTTRVLLKDGDRAGLLAWVETPNVKQVFLVLKESLHSLFSPTVRDLLDETQTPEGRPPRNFLTFLDTGISEERLVFVRVRERLYEFHIAPGKEDAMYKLVEALTE